MRTAKEMEDYLVKEHGFRFLRSRGSHFRYTDGKGHYVTIPMGHGGKEILKPKVEKSILVQAGLK